MKKIKTIATKTMQLGFINESEKILRSLMIAQIEEMGTLHEETLETITLLGHNLSLMKRWNDIEDLVQYLKEAASEISFAHAPLERSIQELDRLLNQGLRIVG